MSLDTCVEPGGHDLVGTHGWLYRYVRCWNLGCDLKVRVGRRGKRCGLYDTQGESFARYHDMIGPR